MGRTGVQLAEGFDTVRQQAAWPGVARSLLADAGEDEGDVVLAVLAQCLGHCGAGAAQRGAGAGQRGSERGA